MKENRNQAMVVLSWLANLEYRLASRRVGKIFTARFGARTRSGKIDYLEIFHLSPIARISGNRVRKFERGFSRVLWTARVPGIQSLNVKALVLLGTGFMLMIGMYISKIPAPILSWGNITRRFSTMPRLPQQNSDLL